MEERYSHKIRQIVEDLEADPEVTAVVFFGSVQRGERKRDSDLDFFVVTTGREYWRSAREIDGVVAELFHNPVPQDATDAAERGPDRPSRICHRRAYH